jgi:hypothetical protein
MTTHSHSHSFLPARPSWAPRTVLVYPAKRTVSWGALFALATFLLIAALVFTAALLMRPIPVLFNA